MTRAFTAEQIAEKSAKAKAAWHKKYSPAQTEKVLSILLQPKKRTTPAQVRGGKVPTEHAEQAAVVTWFYTFANGFYGLDYRILIAIPNGSMLAGDTRMRSIQARRLKNEGVRVGVPDLLLATPSFSNEEFRHYCGLFIEMKRSNWKEPTSGEKLEHWKNQCAFHQMLQNQGYRVRVCAGADDAINAIKEYLG